jgi:ABC-type Na+ efflux pump permease subunit
MSLLSERTWRTWEMLRATPGTAAELLIGKAVPVLAVPLLQQAVVIGYRAGVADLSVTGPHRNCTWRADHGRVPDDEVRTQRLEVQE